jgi:hypothetical protein
VTNNKHTLTGYKAKLLHGELKNLATINEALLLTLIDQTLEREKDSKLALKALQNNVHIRVILDKLCDGKVQEAEDYAVQITRRRKR